MTQFPTRRDCLLSRNRDAFPTRKFVEEMVQSSFSNINASTIALDPARTSTRRSRIA